MTAYANSSNRVNEIKYLQKCFKKMLRVQILKKMIKIAMKKMSKICEEIIECKA